MVGRTYINKWKITDAPWKTSDQVEQDLIISRTLIAIFSDDYLRSHLAFRGGTALTKLYLKPPPRYSEDIDLVQIKSEPIKPIMQRIGEVIDYFDIPRNTKIAGHGAKAFYKFDSESGNRLRLKIEINCQEHFHVLPHEEINFDVANDWFSGTAKLTTYNLNELLGTKLRALYQRKKGRDLFDLYYASQVADIDINTIVPCFKEYMAQGSGLKPPTQKQFINNIKDKEQDRDFTSDMSLLLRPEIKYDQSKAFEWIIDEVASRI